MSKCFTTINTIYLGPRSQGTISTFYLLHFILNALAFSGLRKSMWYHFIPPIWILWRLSSFTSIKHILFIIRVLFQGPGGIQRAEIGRCLLTGHSHSTLQLQAARHPITALLWGGQNITRHRLVEKRNRGSMWGPK